MGIIDAPPHPAFILLAVAFAAWYLWRKRDEDGVAEEIRARFNGWWKL